MRRDLTDPQDIWWTIDQAAEHFGVKRRTILDWIKRDGLTVWGKTEMIRRDDLLRSYQTSYRNHTSGRMRPSMQSGIAPKTP